MVYNSEPAIDSTAVHGARLATVLRRGMETGGILRVEEGDNDSFYVTFNPDMDASMALQTLAMIIDVSHPNEVQAVYPDDGSIVAAFPSSSPTTTIRLWWD